MKKDQTTMDEQSMTEVLKAILEHEQQAEKFMNTVEAQRKEDSERIAGLFKNAEQLIGSFEKKFSSIRIDAPKPDLSAVITVMERGFEGVRAEVNARPKPINRSFQFNFFPETNRREYYRMVFGRLFFWCFAFLSLIYAYNLAASGINAYTAKQNNVDGNVHIRAWNKIYESANKKTRAYLDKTLEDAEADH